LGATRLKFGGVLSAWQKTGRLDKSSIARHFDVRELAAREMPRTKLVCSDRFTRSPRTACARRRDAGL